MSAERKLSFECFGGSVSVHLRHPDAEWAEGALARSRAILLEAHERLSRFEPSSELSRLNCDPRTEVPASPLLRRFLAAVLTAGVSSRGMVDATMLDAIERAGYTKTLAPVDGSSRPALRRPAHFAAAAPAPEANWSTVVVDDEAGTIIRPPGVKFDSGGIAKGLLADIVGGSLEDVAAFAVDCCGDMRIGGIARRERKVMVEDPFGGEPIDELLVAAGGVATSGITRRSWRGRGGEGAHQLLDPSTGEPAYTGVVQATALAPTALQAEVFAKAALLSGPRDGLGWLPFGGVLVLEDRSRLAAPAPQRLPDPVGKALA